MYPVPDGDTGTNMARTLDAVVAEMDAAPDELDPTCDAISHGSLMGARGNSGVILSQIMRGIAVDAEGSVGRSRPATVADALQAASDAAYQAVLKPIEGTILTVVRESADAAPRGGRRRRASLAACCGRPATPAAASLARTPSCCRCSRDAGVVDAGGAGFLLLLDAAAARRRRRAAARAPPATTPAARSARRSRPSPAARPASTASSTSASSATR